MGVDIPDESPWGPVPDVVRVEFVDSGEITPELTVGLLADIKQVQRERDAVIARAAQVQILREMAETLRTRDVDRSHGEYSATGYEPWTLLWNKANELEQESP
jgi:hypothetical protein